MRRTKGLYRRGNIYWIAYRAGGKLCRESTGTTLQREAEYILSCRKKEIKEGKIPEVKKIKNYKFAELAQNYLVWVEHQRAYKSKKCFIRQIMEVYGNFNINELNTRIIEQWQSENLKKSKPSTVNRLTACLRHMINKGAEWGMVPEEITNCMKKVKMQKENNKRLRFLTSEETQILIESCASHLKPIVITALHTGMRRGEILKLKWEHVDLKHRFILLDKTKTGERREIPINRTLDQLFNSMPRSIESEYVFVDNSGKPYCEVKRSFKTALNKAGIRDFHFHDMRHTFASHLVMQGVDLVSVKELLGHKSLTMTLRYAHLAPGHKKRAVQILDGVFGNGKSENNVHNLFTISTPELAFQKS